MEIPPSNENLSSKKCVLESADESFHLRSQDSFLNGNQGKFTQSWKMTEKLKIQRSSMYAG